MPDKVSREKIDLLRAYGAKVVLCPTHVEPESPESYYSVSDRLADRDPRGVQARPVPQPGEPGGPLRLDRARDVGAERRADHPPGGRRRHRRHDHRHRALPEGAEPGRSRSSAPTRPARSTPARRSTRTWSRASARTSGRRPSTRASSTATSASPTATASSPRAGWRETEGMLAGGSCGLAVHAALAVAARIDDPEALVVVILPDGGRAYLQQDLQRHLDGVRVARADGDRSVGDVLRASTPPARSRRSSSSSRASRSGTPSRCCTSTGSPSSRSSPHDPHTSSARSASAACCARGRQPGGHGRADRRRDGAAVPRRLGRGPGARGRRAALRRPPGAARHRATACRPASSPAPTCWSPWSR